MPNRSTTLPDDGQYRLEVEATGVRGNNGSLHLPITIANDVSLLDVCIAMGLLARGVSDRLSPDE